jgi:arylsulfatase
VQHSRRDLLKISLAPATTKAALSPYVGRTERLSGRPNILFVVTDQHRGDCLGSDGNPVVRTPTFDWLARDGVRFSRAYTSTPSCTPARSAILTGLSPWRHGMLGYGQIASTYPTEMPRVLREAGYYTIGIGKMHFTCPERNYHGFHQMLLEEADRADSPDFRSDYRAWFWSEAPNTDPDATGLGWNDYRARAFVLPERFHITRWACDAATNFLRTYNRPKPFFLMLSIERPHSPYDPPSRMMRQYADVAIPAAVVGKWAERYRPLSGPGYDIWHGDVGAKQVRQSRQGYYGSVSFVDEQLGRVFEMLQKRGWLEQTLIVHSADHGDMLGDHFLWRKCQPYEASARVPLLMRWPQGIVPTTRGQIVSRPVELRDILPTFLDAAGIMSHVQFDGRSLLGLVSGRDTQWRQYIDLEHDICYGPDNHWNALTDGKYKYIFHAQDSEEQLFDLDRDPHEQSDLAPYPAYEDQLRHWRQRLIDHLSERGEPFVKNGKLSVRSKRFLYSPNYPGCKGPPTFDKRDVFVE